MKSLKTILLISSGLLLLGTFTACNFDGSDGSKGPIVLGDTSTIVTETDSQYLDDVVMDMPSAGDSLQPPVYKDNFKNVEAAAALSQQLAKDSILEVNKAQAAAIPVEKPKNDKKADKKKVDKKDPKTVSKKDAKNKKDDKKKKDEKNKKKSSKR